MRYSEFVDQLLSHDLLSALQPKSSLDSDLVRRVLGASDASIAGGKSPAHAGMFALVKGGLLYALDALPEAHAIFQEASDDTGSYWHGMLHRREGDFDNARYWFRRAGTLPFFSEAHRNSATHSPTMARQSNWDPYLFTGQCEQVRFGDEDLTAEMRALQRVEFDAIFDYCWRQAALD